jgi:hypothetical protein
MAVIAVGCANAAAAAAAASWIHNRMAVQHLQESLSLGSLVVAETPLCSDLIARSAAASLHMQSSSGILSDTADQPDREFLLLRLSTLALEHGLAVRPCST